MATLYANEVQANDKITTMDGVSYVIKSASLDKGEVVLIGQCIKGEHKGAWSVMRMREVDTVEYLGHIGQRVA